MRIKLFLLLLGISISFSFAQQTSLKGVVVDSLTREPVSYALVSFDNTNTGVSVDDDGSFSISTRGNSTTVKVQALGYNTKLFSVRKGESAELKILLAPKNITLQEVLIKPKKEKYSKKNNPAVELIEKVIANKDRNNIKSLDFYQYKEYERYIFALNEFNPNSGTFKKYDFLTSYIDSSIIDNELILPFSVKEKVTDVFYRKSPKVEKRIIKGQKSEGIDQKLEQQGIEAFIQETFQSVNISDNYITMLFNNFVGPLSEHQAVSFYKWYLGDTIQIDSERFATLDFAPFNNRDVGFTGNLYISLDGTYAVKKAVLRAPKNISVNYVTDMVVVQEFEKDRNGAWLPQEVTTAMNLSLYDAVKMHVNKTVIMEDFLVNMPIAPVYDLPDPELHEKDYLKRPDDFWTAHRPGGNSKDYKMGEMMDDMKDVFLVKMILNLGNIVMTGYVPLNSDPEINKFEIGAIPTLYSHNHVEGNRFKITGNTTKNLHPHLFLYGYLAYGTKDEKLKYRGEATWSFRKIKDTKEEFPVNNLTFSYTYDMNALGQRFNQAARDNVFMSLSSSKKVKMTYNSQFSLFYHKEYHNGFSFKVGAQTNKETPAGDLLFETHHPEAGVTSLKNIKTTEASLMLRYAHKESFFQQRRRRVNIPTEKFVAELTHTTAIKDFLGGQYSYNRTLLNLEKEFWITPYGKLRLNAQGEKLWGRAPFLSLISPSANSSLTVQSGSFYLINPLEFIHDQQVSWEVYYHMGGWLFNRIPLIKLLKWREVFGFRGFYGSLSDKNNPAKNFNQPIFPENSFQTTGKPYMEYNIGIENIFNFFRIDYVRRINYLGHPGIKKHGFRFSFQMDF